MHHATTMSKNERLGRLFKLKVIVRLWLRGTVVCTMHGDGGPDTEDAARDRNVDVT